MCALALFVNFRLAHLILKVLEVLACLMVKLNLISLPTSRLILESINEASPTSSAVLITAQDTSFGSAYDMVIHSSVEFSVLEYGPTLFSFVVPTELIDTTPMASIILFFSSNR
jgi:hypothetical protein